MKRRGRRKAVKWLLICSIIMDPKENSKEENRGMSRKQFRELYGTIIAPQLSIGRSFSRWDYYAYGETADGKTVYLFSDLPPKRYK